MDAVFKKLNFKDQKEVFVINAPDSFEANLNEMKSYTKVLRDINKSEKIDFVMAFVKKQTEIDKIVPDIAEKLQGDGIVWFCYPKGSSKKYTCDFNRDTGWEELGKFGFEGVRMVAIDEDWSALRFRRVEFIKTMIRSDKMAMSKAGKERVQKKK